MTYSGALPEEPKPMWPKPQDSTYRTELTSSGATVVVATGRINFHNAAILRRQLHSLIEDGVVRLVIDLSGVESLDSSGVGALVSGLKAARSSGGDLRLADPSPAVTGIIDLMNLNRLLVQHDSPENAFPREV